MMLGPLETAVKAADAKAVLALSTRWIQSRLSVSIGTPSLAHPWVPHFIVYHYRHRSQRAKRELR
jgi:hypothetical protein